MHYISYWNQPRQFLLLDRKKLPHMLHYTIVCNCNPIERFFFLSKILQCDTTLHGPHPLLWIKVISRADNRTEARVFVIARCSYPSSGYRKTDVMQLL